jgi:TolA-binding protein
LKRNTLFFERARRFFDRSRRTPAACGPPTVVAALLILLFARPASLGAATLQLESNQTLFYVMCAINAAGYDEGINLPDNNPLRRQVRDYLATRQIGVLPELKLFYRHHMQKTAAQDLPQYVSFALSVTGAPDFAWKVRDVDIPPDAMALEGFQTLMIDFYRQADLAALWKYVQPAYEKEIGLYHTPILNMTGTVDAYLRASSADFPNRRFHAIVEPLTAPQHIQTFHYGDNTYVVISPSAQPLIYDIRHAYLFFLIDPVMLTYRADVLQKRSMLDLVQTAPLPDDVKTDFGLLASQSLVKAVEARMDKDTNAIDRATGQGYIMTPYFAEHLPEFEKQQQSMRFYADAMINAIDLKLETARLSNVKFDAAPLQRKATQVIVAGPELSPAGKTLEKAESLYTDRNASPANQQEAKNLFGKALDQKGEPAEHAQAWYGLARIAIIENRADVAIEGFQKALESSPDEFTQSWADVYLGRLYKSKHDFDQAVKYYEAALAVNGASDKAKQAARDGLQDISKNQEKQTP